MITISKLGAEAGVTADTIRYYEREGLLSPAARSAAGYRLYNTEHLDRLRFIRGLRTIAAVKVHEGGVAEMCPFCLAKKKGR
ncbi:MAG: MerR family transcriptional regulator [Actinomycetota bacterium]|nr:MerR family transcriptional regulator [Actinomycetota bacterium]